MRLTPGDENENGSYEIHYVLSYAQEALPVLAMAATSAPGSLSQITQVLSDLGVIKKAGAGVLDVINKLRGKPKEIEEVAPNQYKAESEHGSIVVDGQVKKLIQNSIVIENLNVTIAPATMSDVKDIRTYLAQNPLETSVTVKKEVAGAVEKYVREINKPSDDVKENVTTVWVHPHRGPFSGDPGQWWFKRGRGDPFRASIKNKGFLESYGRGNRA